MSSVVVSQNANIRDIRRAYTGVGQRTLAKRIVDGEFQSRYPGLAQRTFASIYGIIRRHDGVAKQVAASKPAPASNSAPC